MAETFAEITFPLSKAGQLTGNVNRVQIRRREYQHELLIVDVWKKRGRDLSLRSGSPVSAKVKGPSAKPITFVGYVDTVNEIASKNTSTRHLHRIVCVGPTYRMKESRRRVWRNVTLSEVARKICKEYRLSGVIENHTTRTTFHQAGESDWEFLCRIARTYGYVVYPVGTSLHVHSRDYRTDERHQRAHLLRYLELPDGKTDIIKFSGKFSEAGVSSEGRKAKRVVSNVDPKRGSAFSARDDGRSRLVTRAESLPGRFTSHESVVALTARDGMARALGAAERTRWGYTADAEVEGRPDVAPTSVLYLDGLDNGYEGYWTVTGVDHVFADKYRYYMRVDLGTDSVGTTRQKVLPGDPKRWTPTKSNESVLLGTGPAENLQWAATTAGLPETIKRVLSVRRERRIAIPVDVYVDAYLDYYL